MIMTMITVNVHEAKARLSEYLEAVAGGERVVICNRNRPVAELRAIAQTRTEPRPIGGASGLTIPASFFEPLPPEVENAFYGEVKGRPSRAAEDKGAPARTPRRRGGRRT